MKERSFDEMIAYFNRRVADMDISQDCKMELLGMIAAIGYKHKTSVPQWIPCERELPSDNREVEVTCKVRRLDGKEYEYTCHASYVHRYSIESTDYCNWEECDEYNEEEDKYYALPGWYERVHNWDEYSYCAIEDRVVAWRELPEPWRGEEKK